MAAGSSEWLGGKPPVEHFPEDGIIQAANEGLKSAALYKGHMGEAGFSNKGGKTAAELLIEATEADIRTPGDIWIDPDTEEYNPTKPGKGW